MRTDKINKRLLFGGTLILILSMYSCAKQGTLSGGPKDLQPPILDNELSDQNFQTNYYPEGISLYFDEWIQLKNPSQILISPPLKTRPEISFKGKHVDIVFDEEEVLRDSTTYAINFGNAITDFTESNPVKNFRFVFATGDKIDSLALWVKVIDSYTEEPIEDVVVMLYDQDRDSIVYEEQPYYFARTDKKGTCTIQNIRAGNFKCFALVDGNFNFLFDQEGEQIGFVDSLISIRNEEMLQSVNIELFMPEPSLQIVEDEIQKRGKLRLKTNKNIKDIDLIESNVDFLHKEILYDSIFFWYRPDTSQADSIFMVLNLEGKHDSLIIKSKKNTSSIGKMLFRNFRSKKVKLKPGNPIELDFNQIIDSIDTSKLTFQTVIQKRTTQTDSLTEAPVDTMPKNISFTARIDSNDLRKLLLSAALEENQQYNITLYPGAVKGFFENQNDTLISNVEMELRENLGNIFCKFDSLYENQQYVVLLKQKDRVIEERIVYGKVQATVEFLLMNPGKYYLDVIVDQNKNGKWDPGDYPEKRQSEQKREIRLEELRKNWDIETEIKWDRP